jgi:PAS domain-containing protein
MGHGFRLVTDGTDTHLALLDTIPNPIFYKGAHTRFLGCNAAYEAAFGIDRHSFIGGLYLLTVVLRFLLQAARADFYNPLSQAIAKITTPVLLPLRRSWLAGGSGAGRQ